MSRYHAIFSWHCATRGVSCREASSLCRILENVREELGTALALKDGCRENRLIASRDPACAEKSGPVYRGGEGGAGGLTGWDVVTGGRRYRGNADAGGRRCRGTPMPGGRRCRGNAEKSGPVYQIRPPYAEKSWPVYRWAGSHVEKCCWVCRPVGHHAEKCCQVYRLARGQAEECRLVYRGRQQRWYSLRHFSALTCLAWYSFRHFSA